MNETVCLENTYQPQEGQSDCIACPQGKQCDPYDGKMLSEEA